MAEPTTREWLRSLIEPGLLLAYAMSSYTKVSLETVFLRGQILAPLLQTNRLRDEAFGRFWIQINAPQENGPDEPSSTAAPVKCSADLIPPILAQASGTVLDIGPGTGTQMPLLRSPSIKAIYGAEPCLGLHGELRARAEAEGLGDKYTILGCSVEAAALLPALKNHGAISDSAEKLPEEGLFDTILCVRVLCSVPNPEQTIRELYSLLKPGGKVLVTEHVVNPWRTPKGSIIARLMQMFYQMIGWSWFLGDCCLTRDTGEMLKKAADADGGWESVDLEPSFGRSPLSYVSGVLVKKSA